MSFVFAGDDGKNNLRERSSFCVPIQEHINVYVLEGDSHITTFLIPLLKCSSSGLLLLRDNEALVIILLLKYIFNISEA